MPRTENTTPAGYARALHEAARLGGITRYQAATVYAILTDAANTLKDELAESQDKPETETRLLAKRAARLAALAKALENEHLDIA